MSTRVDMRTRESEKCLVHREAGTQPLAERTKELQYGLIAEEVATAYPELVIGSESTVRQCAL
jgi:hypothetical protein